ncbi:MAG TPA: hypothetical protein VFK06_16695 [Candidatus Angelobacter sp.]|nr:hypothetical protein [Candidatus Angelobacter sp.]
MKRHVNASAFGQADTTDGREKGDWRSTYDDPLARKAIRVEAAYLALLLFGIPAVMVILWLDYPKYLLHLSDQKYRPLLKYGFAWTAGTFGGVLFDVKWLYHSVARGFWNLDRRLWRFFTPHISGGLSSFVLALIASGGFRIFDSKATDSLSLIMGIGFLVGYFSDSAIAKLGEIAETLFGTIRSKEKHKESTASNEEGVPSRPVSEESR